MHMTAQDNVRLWSFQQHRRGFPAYCAAIEPRIISSAADVVCCIELHTSYIKQQMVEGMHAC